MPMFFLDKRAQVICNELKKESIRQKQLIESWEMAEGDFVTPEQAAREGAFFPFDSRKDHWYGPDRHCWFRTGMTSWNVFPTEPP